MRRGFTLIEMLVVIAIIIILSTVSLALLQNGGHRGGIVSAGQTTCGMFMKTRQLAASERRTFFLVFSDAVDSASGMETGRLEVHRDAVADGVYVPAQDPIVDAAVSLPKGVRFVLSTGVPNPGPAWIGFRPDGSIFTGAMFVDLPTSGFDAAWNAQNPAVATSDLTIESAGHVGRLYLDFTSSTGKIDRQLYWEN